MDNKKYLFKNHPFEDEIKIAINKTNPTKIALLPVFTIDADFNYGDFIINFEDKNYNFKFPFYYSSQNINEFWKFLESSIISIEAHILHLYFASVEHFIYIEKINKYDLRFIIFDTRELIEKQRLGKIIKFSYADMNKNIDIIVNQKIFYKGFYLKLFNFFKSYENIAYFEPPVIDFDFWIKDSKIIKGFLAHK